MPVGFRPTLFLRKNIERLIEEILSNKSNINEKMQNYSNLNFQNTWLNVNQKIVNILDEN